MIKFGLTVVGIVLCSTVAMAQTATPTATPTPTPRPDVLLLPSGATYEVKAMMPVDDFLSQLCCYRVDAPYEADLGCVDAIASSGQVLTMNITIAPTPVDAVVRCKATNTYGDFSDLSPNAGIVDFTVPQPPVLQ